MRHNRVTVFSVITFIFFFFNLGLNFINAQDIDLTAIDTVVDPETFDLSQISRKSAELTLNAKDLAMQAVDEEEFERLETENKEVTKFIDSLLYRETYVRMNTLSSRNLGGKLKYWKQNLQIVNNQEERLSSAFQELNESVNFLESELSLWENTKELVKGDELADAVHKKFDEVNLMIDTTKNALDQKSAKILTLLDVVARQEVEIESLISKIEAVIATKQERMFETDQPGLFSLNYFDGNKWVIPKSYLKYYSGNIAYLTNYLKNHIENIIFHFILLIFLVIGFIKIHKLNIKPGKEVGAKYKNQLVILLSNPISSALIIWLFSTIIIYPYRPLLFLDSIRFLVTVPIVIVLLNILPKKHHKYAYVFGILVILDIVFINLPNTHIVARLILFVIALLETITFIHFVVKSRKNNTLKSTTSKYVLLTVYLLLTLAIIGIFANFIGKVALSKFLAQALLYLVLVSILVSFSLVILNGLSVLFIDSKYGDSLNIIKKYKTKSKHVITRFFNAIATVLILYLALDIFGLRSIIYDWLEEFLTTERNIGSMVFTWGNIVIFFLVIYLSIVIANAIRSFLEEDLLKTVKLKKGVPYTIALMVKYTLVTVGIFIAVSAAGIPTNSLTVILGAFGVGIGFGLQNIFNNLVSGLILLFERPIQIGDTIEVDTVLGNVRSIGIRSSNVRTFDGAEIIVPNGNLISNNVINWTLSDETRRIELFIGVSYSSDPHKVKDLLMNIITNHPEVVSDPEPSVWFQSLGDSSLDFRMLFWTKQFNQWIRIKSEVLFQVFDDLKTAGIEIPFPQRDLHVRSIEQKIELKK